MFDRVQRSYASIVEDTTELHRLVAYATEELEWFAVRGASKLVVLCHGVSTRARRLLERALALKVETYAYVNQVNNDLGCVRASPPLSVCSSGCLYPASSIARSAPLCVLTNRVRGTMAACFLSPARLTNTAGAWC